MGLAALCRKDSLDMSVNKENKMGGTFVLRKQMSFEFKVVLWILEKKSSNKSIPSEGQCPISLGSTSGDLTCQAFRINSHCSSKYSLEW